MRSSFLPKCQLKISRISALPSNKLPGQKSFKFLVGILGETMTSQIYSEFNWPLVVYLTTKQGYLRLCLILPAFWDRWRKYFDALLMTQSNKIFACRNFMPSIKVGGAPGALLLDKQWGASIAMLRRDLTQAKDVHDQIILSNVHTDSKVNFPGLLPPFRLNLFYFQGRPSEMSWGYTLHFFC